MFGRIPSEEIHWLSNIMRSESGSTSGKEPAPNSEDLYWSHIPYPFISLSSAVREATDVCVIFANKLCGSPFSSVIPHFLFWFNYSEFLVFLIKVSWKSFFSSSNSPIPVIMRELLLQCFSTQASKLSDCQISCRQEQEKERKKCLSDRKVSGYPFKWIESQAYIDCCELSPLCL